MPAEGRTGERLVRAALDRPVVRAAARAATDWIDLQWSVTIAGLRRVAPRTRGKLLDVGCGDKPYESIFLPYVDSYVGVEHEASFQLTAASGRRRGPDVVYDGTRLPFDDKTFDTVLNVQVLEHTPRPGALVKEMGRVLADDGLLVLAAPFGFRLHEEPHDYFRYSPHGLRELCKEAGLEVIDLEKQGSLWSVIGHKLNTYLALEVARVGGVAQAMGKLGHEKTGARDGVRVWTLPWVAPTMLGISAAARVLDQVLPDAQEALNFLVVARRRRPQR